MATLKCIQTSYCKSLVEFLIITFTPYTGFIYPTKHVPGFVYKKKRYTTELKLQKCTRCTPFYIKIKCAQ